MGRDLLSIPSFKHTPHSLYSGLARASQTSFPSPLRASQNLIFSWISDLGACVADERLPNTRLPLGVRVEPTIAGPFIVPWIRSDAWSSLLPSLFKYPCRKSFIPSLTWLYRRAFLLVYLLSNSWR